MSRCSKEPCRAVSVSPRRDNLCPQNDRAATLTALPLQSLGMRQPESKLQSPSCLQNILPAQSLPWDVRGWPGAPCTLLTPLQIRKGSQVGAAGALVPLVGHHPALGTQPCRLARRSGGDRAPLGLPGALPLGFFSRGLCVETHHVCDLPCSPLITSSSVQPSAERMPLVPRPELLESNKGAGPGLCQGGRHLLWGWWRVTWLSGKGRSPGHSGLQQPGGTWWSCCERDTWEKGHGAIVPLPRSSSAD